MIQAYFEWASSTPLTTARDEAWWRYVDIRDSLEPGTAEKRERRQLTDYSLIQKTACGEYQ